MNSLLEPKIFGFFECARLAPVVNPKIGGLVGENPTLVFYQMTRVEGSYIYKSPDILRHYFSERSPMCKSPDIIGHYFSTGSSKSPDILGHCFATGSSIYKCSQEKHGRA
ncbi:hypothetical protein E2562_005504 [Oryza meyeriana var. granulata]|uniref:Uncharacterized protein n=1 Tax=Oryza meyeriana var. granulata TaxID=110450 RepID=A0A6G1F3S2_9ORYZ|nr:hypothetical protein E2562_005504 [Oryza meyeriana var. granulata]